MNKVLKITLVLVAILLCTVSAVKAATTNELIAHISKTYTIAGKSVKLSDSDLVKAKRYLAEYPVSSADADKIISKIDEGVALMNKAGVSDPNKLSKAQKSELLNIAQEAAKLAGATISYDANNRSVAIYRDGKQYDSVSLTSYKFASTGANNMIYVITTLGVAIIAIATVIVYRKRKVNA